MSERLGANYWRLWAATTVSNLGDGVRLTALPLLVVSLTRDPLLVAGVGFASTLPWLLFALPSGALVDRLDRRAVMARVNLVRCLLMALLAAVVLTETANVLVLYAVAFALGTAETLFDNAAQAVMPSVVPRHLLTRANGRLQVAEVIANQLAGPPLGAMLFAFAAALPLGLNAVSFGLAALLIFGLRGCFRSSAHPAGVRVPLRTDITEGLRWLWQHRLLRTLAAMLGVWNTFEWAVFSIFVLFAVEILGLGTVGFGVLMTAGTVGSVVGGLAAARLSRAGTTGVLLAQVLLAGIAALVLGSTSNPYVAGAMLAVSGFAGVVWNVITVSLRQSLVPDGLLGRVNSAYRLIGWGTLPLGAVIGGGLAKVAGLRAPLYAQAVVLLAAVVVVSRMLGAHGSPEAGPTDGRLVPTVPPTTPTLLPRGRRKVTGDGRRDLSSPAEDQGTSNDKR